jgi:hypothetical protein
MRLRPHTVTVHGAREADFERVYGSTTVQVKSPIPHYATLPGFDEPQLVYLLDLEWAEREGHRARLVEFIAERFDQDPAYVDRHLDKEGMPILAESTVACVDPRYVL